MIIVTDRGYHCRKSLLNACLKYPTSFILLTSTKLKKNPRAAPPPSEAVAPLIFLFTIFSIWISESVLQSYFLSQ